MNKKIFIIVGIAVVLIITIALVVILKTKKTTTTNEKTNIVWWQPYDNKEALTPIIEAYQKSHPNVTITYVKKDHKSLEDYQNKVVNGLANGEGPDIWSLQNSWLPIHYKKLAPMPASVMTKETYGKKFFPIVESEMTIKSDDGQENIYGIPFSLDTLVLLYNRDQLLKSDISDPPKTWNEFVADVGKLTKRNGNIVQQAGAACGTSGNIEHSFDALSLMMLQNGTTMVSDKKNEVYFNRSDEKNGKPYYPGTSALKFYTDFAEPNKTAYTWNNSMPSDLEAFIDGKVSMMFGYSRDITIIKKRAPQLRFGVAAIPQIKEGDNLSYASFWSEVVSKNSKNSDEAWNFLKFCFEKDNINKYYEAKESAGESVPSSIMEKAKTQEGRSQDIGPIVKQSKDAKSWYQGDANQMQNIFAKMINAVVERQPSQAAIDAAAKNANQMLSEMD